MNTLPTGYQQLDQALPSGGWPLGVVVELLPESVGIGELRLMLPAIRNLTQNQKHVVMINAPHIPYAPALTNAGLDLDYLLSIMPGNWRDTLWAAEKALLNSICGMVLLWSGGQRPKEKRILGNAVIRRFQVAAQSSDAILVLYRFPDQYRQGGQTAWAAVRLRLVGKGDDLVIEMLKIRGTHRRYRIHLDLEKYE